MLCCAVSKTTGLVINRISVENENDIPVENTEFLYIINENAQIGWSYSDGNFHPPLTLQPTFNEKVEILLNRVREIRAEKELGGILFNGIPIRTDDKSQSKLQGVITLFSINPNLAGVDWEAVPGTFVTLDKNTLMAIAVAVGGHIQDCFTKSKQLTEEILATETIEELEAIDIDSGWPGV